MPVHYAGDPGKLDQLYKVAKRHNLLVIEDAAHAFGSNFQEKRIGSFGDIACFSFDGIKNITSGEGGCIVSDDLSFIEKVKDLRLLGVINDSEKRFKGERSWDFDSIHQGWRYHMSNIMAAIGIEQLKKFPKFLKKRQSLAKKYDALFLKDQLIRPFKRDYDNIVPHIYVVRIKGLRDRKSLQQKMLKKRVQVGYHYLPNHFLTKYKNTRKTSLDITESIFEELLTLPMHPDLSEYDLDYIGRELKKLVNE